VEVETIMDVTARLAVNRASLKTKTARINELTDKMEKQLKKNSING